MQTWIHSKQLKLFFLFPLFIIISFTRCKEKQYIDPYANVKVNQLFAVDPPVASNIEMSLLKEPLESGNLLYEVSLPREKIASDVHALFVGDSNKIVLHDDGKNGDRIAGDGVFSTVLKVNADSVGIVLHDQMLNSQRLLESKTPIFKFSGRMFFSVDREALTRDFGPNQLKLSATELLKTPFHLFPFPLLLPISASFKQSCLMVTDPAVVNDSARTFNPCTNKGTPGGAWTFGKLMTDMANTPVTGITPADFVLSWLNTWTVTHTVNSDFLAIRQNITKIINEWHTLSGGPAAPLDVNKVPFKLLAIVNRFDLRSGGAYGGGNAGEGRFIFVATDANCQPFAGPAHFLVIFEYGVNKTSCGSIHAYAKQWVDLQAFSLGSPAYNNALQAITDQFALANTNNSKPNNNSLDQLRTNEFAIGPLPWELREFHIDTNTHKLINVTVVREPQVVFNSQTSTQFGISVPADVVAFGDFVNANAVQVIKDKQELPLTIPVSGTQTAFIAGKAHTQDPSTFHWDALVNAGAGHITNDTARMHISLNTCSGCHGGETKTGTFTHVDLESGTIHLSPFLTGLVQPIGQPVQFSSLPFIVSDPAQRPSAASPAQWPFNDLERRGRDIQDFLSTPCFKFPPGRFPLPLLLPFELAKQLRFTPLTMSD
jgi:hypothetical protein